MLQRQTSGSSVIAENLKKFQMQLEKTDNEDKKRLQVIHHFFSLCPLFYLKFIWNWNYSYHKNAQTVQYSNGGKPEL